LRSACFFFASTILQRLGIVATQVSQFVALPLSWKFSQSLIKPASYLSGQLKKLPPFFSR